MRPARKVNPNAGSSSTTGEVYVNEVANQGPVDQLPGVVEDEFWDYDKQVDLEGTCFSCKSVSYYSILISICLQMARSSTYYLRTSPGFTSSKLYEHLDHQGHTILTGLSKQKQGAKALYMRVADQNESLKGLWVSKMRLKGKSSIATAEDLQDYEDRKRELEEERERRKRVGADVGKVCFPFLRFNADN